jgi:hypothetical protein
MASKLREYLPGPYTVLLAILLCFIALTPIVAEGERGSTFLRVGFSAIFLAGIYVSGSSRRLVERVEVYLVCIVLAVEWGTLFFDLTDTSDGIIRSVSFAVILFLTAFVQLKALLKQREVSSDTIAGGINIYALMALGFMMLHAFVEIIEPGSYLVFGQDLTAYLVEEGQQTTVPTLMYFSFVTITTLGYGDIVPVTGISRNLVSMEAFFGQLYLATFVARIVGLYVGSQSASRSVPQDAED